MAGDYISVLNDTCFVADDVWLMQGVCHRDLKLENTLLDGRPAPRLKICDFGYSKVTCCRQTAHGACLAST